MKVTTYVTPFDALRAWRLEDPDPMRSYPLATGGSLRFATHLNQWPDLDPLLQRRRVPLATLDCPSLPLCHWRHEPGSTWPEDMHELPCRAIIVGAKTGTPGWELWAPDVPGVWCMVTPLGQCMVTDTPLVRETVEQLRFFCQRPVYVGEWTFGITRVFRAKLVRVNHGWDMVQWHTTEDDLGKGCSGALFVLQCLQRLGIPFSCRADSNIYGRLTQADRASLFEPWASSDEANAFETDPAARRNIKVIARVPCVAPGDPVDVTWHRPTKVPTGVYEKLYDTLSAIARDAMVATRKHVETVIHTRLGALDVTWPMETGSILVLSMRWAAGVHRHDQPLMAQDMDKDTRDTLAVLRLALEGTTTKVTLTAEAARELGIEGNVFV